jgi:serine/threonine protein kinase
MSQNLTGASSIASIVALAADEYLEQLGRGEAPDVRDYTRRYPQVASILPQVLPTLRMIQALAPDAETQTPLPLETDLLGEYRLLREIGRGGMGVVYEAEQIPLGRRVALKLLPMTTLSNAKQLARFQIETQVAAALHHPHIVPIFGVGCDHGVHYYAMQLVEGHSLADLIREWKQLPVNDNAVEIAPPSNVRNRLTPYQVARLTRQAAEALDHAHTLGVLHRDVKPANLLVDEHAHLWVTDFGLARFQGTGDLTNSGDMPGTLRYMSPEQVTGGRILDPRTDVYSLGATLYELLTSQPAFGGRTQQQLIHQITSSEPVPPRKLEPSIPRDLETIVARAMAKEPEHRYATAQALADDLGRFLDDQPICARPTALPERVARWSQRHWKTTAIAATLSLVTALALTAGIAQLWKQQRLTHSALQKAQEAELRERAALSFTFTASDQIAERALSMLAVPASVRPPDELEKNREFCRKALRYYEEIAIRYTDGPGMQAIAAAAHHRVGFIRAILGEPQAEAALRRSVTLYNELIADAPCTEDLRSALAQTYGDLVFLLSKSGNSAETAKALETLVALRQGLVADFPTNEEYQISLTYNQADLCGLLENLGRCRQADEIRKRLKGRYRSTLDCKRSDHRLRNNLAWLLASRPRTSPDEVTIALSLAKEATTLAPETGAYWNTLGVAHYRACDWQATVIAIERSMQLRSGGDPNDWLFLAMARMQQGDIVRARKWYEQSITWIEAHASHDPDLLRFRAEAICLLGPEPSPLSKTARAVTPSK